MQIIKKKIKDKTILDIQGSIDTLSSPNLLNVLQNLLKDNVWNIEINFEKVDYISSAGLKTLLTISKDMQGKGELVLKNMNARVKQVFEITGFIPLFNIK